MSSNIFERFVVYSPTKKKYLQLKLNNKKSDIIHYNASLRVTPFEFISGAIINSDNILNTLNDYIIKLEEITTNQNHKYYKSRVYIKIRLKALKSVINESNLQVIDANNMIPIFKHNKKTNVYQIKTRNLTKTCSNCGSMLISEHAMVGQYRICPFCITDIHKKLDEFKGQYLKHDPDFDERRTSEKFVNNFL